jgi:hypothetical protein
MSDGRMIIHSGSVAAIGALIFAGRNGESLPYWDGAGGIITSQAAAANGNLTTVGAALASDVRHSTLTATALWGGQTITGTDILLMYTYGGDATLDGKINIDDYVRIDTGLAAGATGWSNGDFNYDGKINIDDYTQIIDVNIGNQVAGIIPPASGIESAITSVPEPTGTAAVALLLAAGLPLRGKRRRRR